MEGCEADAHELDYIPLTTSSTQNKGNTERIHSSSYRLGAKRAHPMRTTPTSLLPQTGNNQQRPSKKLKRTRFYAKERSSPAAATNVSGGSAFVVPDGESVTLRPPRGIVTTSNERTRERVNVARLEEEGWTRTDLCSHITRHPSRFANINMVVLFDLDNAAGWFNIHQRVLPNVLVLVFCGSGGVYGSLPRRPLLAGFMSDDRLFVTVCGGGKNSADFGLTYTAGELNRLMPKECMFAIVSNDTDFKHLMSHLRKTRPNSYQIKANSAVMANKHLHCILGVLERRLLIDQAIRKQEEQSREVVLILDDVSETGEATGGDDADERLENGYGQRKTYAALSKSTAGVEEALRGRSSSSNDVQRSTEKEEDEDEDEAGCVIIVEDTPPSCFPSRPKIQAKALKQPDSVRCSSRSAPVQAKHHHNSTASGSGIKRSQRPAQSACAVAIIDLTKE